MIACWRAVIAILIAGSVAACGEYGAAQSNGMVQVSNSSAEGASIHWQSEGLLGTPLFGGSGTEPLGACSIGSRGFAPGHHAITISNAAGSKTFELAAPPDGEATLNISISADGAIAEAQSLPSPQCR